MKPQRILIADDDEKVVALLKSSLRRAGYETTLAANGVEALEFAKKEQPDLILADITMPEMDGFELCRLIREDPVTTHIPFVFLTAKGELHDKVAGLNLGADDYISKPFHISEVTARIKTILQRMTVMAQRADESEESDLTGNLEQMQLAEVIQTLTMSQKTGGLKITNDAQRVGKIYFDNGNIIQASLGNHKSEEAVYRILIWEEGYFEFDSRDRSVQFPIQVSMNSLLMEGFNQREEYLKYKKAMPSFTNVLNVRGRISAHSIKPTSQKVLALIDGQRTIQQVIDASFLNYLLTVKIIYTLLKKDTLEIKEQDPFTQTDQEDFGQLAQELYE